MAGKSFKGNLEVLNLSDIFQSLAMNRHSGTLVVNDGKREKKIFFAEGEICLLSSGRRMRLGDLLVANDRITSEDLDLALKLQKQSRKRLGEILVEEGFCAQEDVEGIVRLQVEEELYDLFLWRKAEFEFLADQMPEDMAAESSSLTRLSINTNSLIMEALRRLDEWTLIQDAVPSTKEVFVVADVSRLGEADIPDKVRDALQETVDGKTTVMGLSERWFLSEFESCQHLAQLVKLGCVRSLSEEELADKAEASYALNDFNAAAALYGRLAEYLPDQPKILIPLADSLRRTGGEKQALHIYGELSQQLEADGRDPDRLRQCYEAILQLDPGRHDLANKIEDLDLRLASSSGSRKVLPLVLLALMVAVLGGALVFRERIKAALGSGANDADREKEVGELVDAITRAEKDAIPLIVRGQADEADKKLQEWHVAARKIWTDYGDTREFARVELPLLVATNPPGFAVYVRYGNEDRYQGTTSLQQPHVLCKYEPVESADGEAAKITVEVFDSEEANKAGKPSRASVEVPAESYSKPLSIPVYDKPISQIITDGWLDSGGIHVKELSAVFLPSREGKLRVMTLADQRLQEMPDWDGKIELGQPGDPLPAPAQAGQDLLLPVVEREGKTGVLHVRAVPGEAPTDPTLRFPTDEVVPVSPLVLAGEGEPLVIAGTLGGTLYAFSLAGEERWRANVEGAVRATCLIPGEPQRVLVMSEDQVVRAFTPRGTLAWRWDAPSPLAQREPLLLEGEVVLCLEEGRVVALDANSGELRREVFEAAPGRLPALASEGGVLYLLDRDAVLHAYQGEKELWSRTLLRKAERRPWLVVEGGRIFLACDGPELIALEHERGRTVWLGRFPQEGHVVAPMIVVDDAVVVTTNRNLIYHFQLPKKE